MVKFNYYLPTAHRGREERPYYLHYQHSKDGYGWKDYLPTFLRLDR